MSDERKPKPADAVSLSGNPIYHHREERDWQLPAAEGRIEEISGHIETYLGPVETVFHERVSDTVHIDVHVVKATPVFPYHRLVTSGMSDLPMATPDMPDIPRHMELMITLPASWRLDQEAFQIEDERWYWPVRLLKFLARLPHKYDTWLGWGHTVPNGDPPKPYAPTTALCGAILLPSVTVPEGFHQLSCEDGASITFMAVVPLYPAEMALKLREGSDELLARFGKQDVSDIVDLQRADVAARRFRFW